MRLPLRSCAVFLALLSSLAGCAWIGVGEGPALPELPSASVPARPRIDKASQLPRFEYPVQGRLEDLVRLPDRFSAWAAPVRRDTLSVLRGYEIADKATRRDLLATLAALDYLDGRYAEALDGLEQVRALQDKPADRWVSGLRLRVAARAAQRHEPGTPAFTATVAAMLRDELQAMPHPVVAHEIRELKASAEISGEGLALGRVREVLQPLVDARGALTSDTAPALVSARLALAMTLPLKSTWVTTLGAWLDRHRVDKPDIWAARAVTLPPGPGHAIVPLAVWDSGVDTALYRPQLLLDAEGRVPIIGFDRYARPADTELAPLPESLRPRLAGLVARSKGFSDLQANIESPESAEVKRWLSGLDASRYRPAIEEINLIGNYEHGTHVAGIALAGNPHARLLVARIEFSHTLQPDPCPTRELVLRDAANSRETVAFFRRHGVRVVNMSWGGSLADVESDLEKCGSGGSVEGRRALARELFDLQKDGLVAALSSAPEILFVAAAGNENQDASFTESTPADIVLPNLLTVGAVDQAGDEASFTSYGPTVRLHANGYQVESFVPGGARVALSGTSMAAPQVSNLAAKLLAVRPSLTPPELIALMTGTADRLPDGRRQLMNPQRAMAALRAR